jgi:hypothetical protein
LVSKIRAKIGRRVIIVYFKRPCGSRFAMCEREKMNERKKMVEKDRLDK